MTALKYYKIKFYIPLSILLLQIVLCNAQPQQPDSVPQDVKVKKKDKPSLSDHDTHSYKVKENLDEKPEKIYLADTKKYPTLKTSSNLTANESSNSTTSKVLNFY